MLTAGTRFVASGKSFRITNLKVGKMFIPPRYSQLLHIYKGSSALLIDAVMSTEQGAELVPRTKHSPMARATIPLDNSKIGCDSRSSLTLAQLLGQHGVSRSLYCHSEPLLIMPSSSATGHDFQAFGFSLCLLPTG